MYGLNATKVLRLAGLPKRQQ